MKRTWGNRIARAFYCFLRFFYVSFWFYFVPFTSLFCSYQIPYIYSGAIPDPAGSPVDAVPVNY